MGVVGIYIYDIYNDISFGRSALKEGVFHVFMFSWIYIVCDIKQKIKLATWAIIGQCLLGEQCCPWVSHFVYAGAFQLYENYVSTQFKSFITWSSCCVLCNKLPFLCSNCVIFVLYSDFYKCYYIWWTEMRFKGLEKIFLTEFIYKCLKDIWFYFGMIIEIQ